MSFTPPVAGQVLGWNVTTTQWEPTSPAVASTGVTSVGGGVGLLGGPITSAGTLNVDVGSAANKIVQENANAQIAQIAGTAAQPAYAFAGNLGTGVYSPGAGQMALVSNGSAALSITADGHVGIGSTAPTQALDVIGNAQVTGAVILKGSNAQLMNWSSTSNVPAIQSTAPSSPGQLAVIPSGSSTTSSFVASGTPSYGSNSTVELKQSGNNSFLRYGSATGSLNLGTPSYIQMTFVPNGNIGIGTFLPQAALDIAVTGSASALIVPRDSTVNRPALPVNGMLRYNTSVAAMEGFVNGAWATLSSGSSAGTVTNVVAGPGLLGGPITSAGTLTVDVGSAAGKIVQENASAQILQLPGSAALPSFGFAGSPATGVFSPGLNQLALATSGSAALTIANTGYVGIGTATPGVPFDVTGATRVNVNSNDAVEIASLQGGASTFVQTVLGVSLLSNNLHYNSGFTPTNQFWGGSYIRQSQGQIDFAVNPMGSNAVNTVMTISSLGRVGIGSGSPQAALDIAMTGSGSALIVPRDTTANRPGAAVNGMLRYNTSANAMESFVNGAWATLATGSTAGGLTYLDVGSAANKIVQENANAQIAQLPGNAAAPAYTFAGNTATGVFSPGANQLAFATNGSAAVSIAGQRRRGVQFIEYLEQFGDRRGPGFGRHGRRGTTECGFLGQQPDTDLFSVQ